MKFRRALLLADLRVDPGPATTALQSVAPALQHVLVVSRSRGLSRWWSTEEPMSPDAGELAALDAWRKAAAAVAPADVKDAPDLPIETLMELALTEDVDLLVAGSRTFDSAPLLLLAARRLAIAALWPAGPLKSAPVQRVFCAALGRHSRGVIASFLRAHTGPSHEVTILGLRPLSPDEITAALQVVGVDTRVRLLPRTLLPLPAALGAEQKRGPIDLVVLPRLRTIPLVLHDWPAPVLVVPQGEAPADRKGPNFDITDLIAIDGTLRARVHEIAVGSMSPAEDLTLRFLAKGRVIADAVTTSSGDLELASDIDVPWLGALAGPTDSTPNALAAFEHRVAVLRPGSRPLLLFDCELPEERLRALRQVAAEDAFEPLAIRLRPRRRAAEIRQRLEAMKLPGYVVDARTVLDEGDAYDVAEMNDPVRLRRVAAKMRAAGFRISSILHRGLEGPAPFTEPRIDPSPGNRIEIELDNSKARRWLLEAIDRSRSSVNLQVYMALDDEIGKAVDAALARAAAREVTVRVLVDSLHGLHGSFGTENSLLSRLATHAGIELRVSRPVTKLPSLADIKLRDHRKLVVVDDRIALVGGRNLSHEYYTGFGEVALTPSANWRHVPWLDAGSRIEGPAVGAIASAFVAAWTSAGGSPFSIEAPPPAGSTAARVVVHHGLQDAHTLEAYLDLIERARSHVYLVNGFPYVLELQHALLRAIRRGVRVIALSGHLTPMHEGIPFPGPWSTTRTTGTEFVHSRLDPIVEAGGSVYLFAQRDLPGWAPGLGTVAMHVHAKLMSADGERCAVGSANFDVTSSYWESELMVVVEDPIVAEPLERRIDELLAASIRVDRADPVWRERAQRRRWMRRWPGVLGI